MLKGTWANTGRLAFNMTLENLKKEESKKRKVGFFLVFFFSLFSLKNFELRKDIGSLVLKSEFFLV